jgi:hypothetical protein
VARADEFKARGLRTDRDSLTVEDAYLRPETTADKPVVDVLAKDAASKVIRVADGSVVSEDSAANLTFRTTLRWTGSGWEVTESKLVQG